jgi:hypothetical protein
VAGPAKAHSIGTCWSSNMPINSAFASVLSNRSAASSPVMYSAPAIDSNDVRIDGVRVDLVATNCVFDD